LSGFPFYYEEQVAPCLNGQILACEVSAQHCNMADGQTKFVGDASAFGNQQLKIHR
jgi:hypothetical protein